MFIGGFPADALPRELDNLCRFFPGFVTSNISTAKGVTLFVLFDSADSAHAAIEELNGQMFDRSVPGEPMRATMARSNMRSTSTNPAGAAAHTAQSYSPSKGTWGGGAPMYQPPPPAHPPPPGHPGTSGTTKRPRIPEDPSQVDTLASVGALEAGFDEECLRAFFETCPGFLDFKANPRMSGGFVKFASPALAVQAVQMAKDEGIPAEMAKSSMSVSTGLQGSQVEAPSHPPAHAAVTRATHATHHAPSHSNGHSTTYDYASAHGNGHSRPSSGGGVKRPRIPEDPSQVDTVASVGAAEAGFDEASLRLFYQTLPGFVAFKGNPRMGGGFAKFSSADLAISAVHKAQEQGVPAEVARSSMSVT